MKKILTIVALSILVLQACNSNKKTDTNGATVATEKETEASSTCTCMINGKPWAAKEFNCGISKKVGIVGLTFYCPEGKNSQQLLLATIDTEKYKVGGGIIYKKTELGGFNMNLAGYSIRDEKMKDLKNYAITEGEVKITTAKDDRAIGIFSFTAVDKEHGGETITITDGKFNVEMNVEK